MSLRALIPHNYLVATPPTWGWFCPPFQRREGLRIKFPFQQEATNRALTCHFQQIYLLRRHLISQGFPPPQSRRDGGKIIIWKWNSGCKWKASGKTFGSLESHGQENCKRSTKQLENVNRIKRSAFYSHSASLARVNTLREKFWHGSSAKLLQLQNRMIVWLSGTA